MLIFYICWQKKSFKSTNIYYLFIYFETLNNIYGVKYVFIQNIIVYNNFYFIYYLKNNILENYEILVI